MGTWGDSIFADDDAQDMYHHYRTLYNEGKEHDDVRQEMQRIFADEIRDSDDGPIFWFAVARAQWEFGSLDPKVLKQVEKIMKEGLGLDRWREGGEKMLVRRKKVRGEFLDKIRQPNPKEALRADLPRRRLPGHRPVRRLVRGGASAIDARQAPGRDRRCGPLGMACRRASSYTLLRKAPVAWCKAQGLGTPDDDALLCPLPPQDEKADQRRRAN
jgi:hypothetical protein